MSITISKNEFGGKNKTSQESRNRFVPVILTHLHASIIYTYPIEHSSRTKMQYAFFLEFKTKTHNIANLHEMTIKFVFIGVLIQTQIFLRFAFFRIINLTISRGLMIDNLQTPLPTN